MNTFLNLKTFLYRTMTIFMTAMLFLAAVPVISASATTAGFFSPTKARSNGAAWKNSSNSFVSDDLYATSVKKNGKMTLSIFNIPAIQGGATIDGIEVTVEGHTVGLDVDVTPCSTATGCATAKTADFTPSSTDTVLTLGGSTETWGKTWASSDFTNANFYVQLKAVGTRRQTISVDQVRVKVYYTLGDSTLTLSPVSGSYGGTTNMTATLTATSSGAAIVGETISFSINGASAGSAVTNSSGVATVSGVSLVGITAGNYPDGAGASFAGGGIYSGTSITSDLYVHGTTTTLTVSPSSGTYTGASGSGTANFSATLTETVSGNPISGKTVNFFLGDLAVGSGTTDSSGIATATGASGLLAGYDAGTYNNEVTAEFAGALIVEPSTGSATLTVNPLTLTVSSSGLTPGNKIYDGNTTASLTIGSPTLNTGVISPDEVALDASGAVGTFSDENVGTNKTVQISGLILTGLDADNYSLTQPTRQANITKASSSVTVDCPVSESYTGSSIEPCTASYSGTGGLSGSLTPTYTSNTNAGTATANASYTGDSNHDGNSGSDTFVINKITPTASITNSPVNFNGSAQTATVACLGGGTATLASGGTGTNAGSYAATVDCAASANYNAASGLSAGNFVINKIAPTASITNSPINYNGSAQTATVACLGGGTATLASGGTGTNAGSYAATVDCAASANYNAASGLSAGNFVINKISPTASIINTPVDYNSSAQSATVACLGGGTATLASGGTGTNAGSYATTVDCAASTNYNAASGLSAGNFVINKASQTITFGALTAKNFGNANFAVNASASSSLAVSFSSTTTGVCTVSSGTVHLVSTGTCTIRASQAGNGNYNAAPNVDQSFAVNAPANVAPVIAEGASINVSMSQDGSTSLTLNATDANGDGITWSISAAAGHGTASASGTGISKIISYTPAPNYIGSDSFVVRVSDGNGGTDTITVNVTITAVEPIPFTIFMPILMR